MVRQRWRYVVERFNRDGTSEPVIPPPRRGWWVMVLMMWDALLRRRQ